MVEGILFEQVEDSRQDWKVKHSVSEILTVVMCGVSAGERSIYGIREFARLKEQWLRNVIGLMQQLNKVSEPLALLCKEMVYHIRQSGLRMNFGNCCIGTR